MSDAVLKLQYNKLTVSVSNVYDKILLLLQQLEVILFYWCAPGTRLHLQVPVVTGGGKFVDSSFHWSPP